VKVNRGWKADAGLVEVSSEMGQALDRLELKLRA